MKIVLMAIGGLIIAFGLVDFVGSFVHFDLWGRMGVRLPDIVWRFSAYIEFAIGYALFKYGRAAAQTGSTVESASAS